MSKPTQDYTWDQGEDLVIDVTYKVNDVPVDLTSYSARMDIAVMSGDTPGPALFSFNSEDLGDSPLDQVGAADNEVTLDSQGNIHIKVSRALTLPGGVIGDGLPSAKVYGYDLFIRNKVTNTQKKLLQGKITISRSITQWA